MIKKQSSRKHVDDHQAEEKRMKELIDQQDKDQEDIEQEELK